VSVSLLCQSASSIELLAAMEGAGRSRSVRVPFHFTKSASHTHALLHTFCRSCDRSIARCASTSRERSSGWSFCACTRGDGMACCMRVTPARGSCPQLLPAAPARCSCPLLLPAAPARVRGLGGTPPTASGARNLQASRGHRAHGHRVARLHRAACARADARRASA
jgi:hypothetical protein